MAVAAADGSASSKDGQYHFNRANDAGKPFSFKRGGGGVNSLLAFYVRLVNTWNILPEAYWTVVQHSILNRLNELIIAEKAATAPTVAVDMTPLSVDSGAMEKLLAQMGSVPLKHVGSDIQGVIIPMAKELNIDDMGGSDVEDDRESVVWQEEESGD